MRLWQCLPQPLLLLCLSFLRGNMTTGYYYFPEQSLEAILYRLSHVYGVQFTVKSEALKRRTFTGTFYRGQSIKDIMEIIHLSIPVRYKIDDHHVTISEI